MCNSWDVHVFEWNREWFLSRRVMLDSGFNVMAGKWSFPTWTKKTFIASPPSGNESWGCGRDPSDSLQESQYYSLLELVEAVSRWMFSGLDLSSKSFDSSICHWKNKFSLFGKYHLLRIESSWSNFRCVHRFQLLKVCDQYVTYPNSQPAYNAYPRKQSR